MKINPFDQIYLGDYLNVWYIHMIKEQKEIKKFDPILSML